MGKFLEVYHKQGGSKLIKEFWHAGVLGDALLLLPILGKSKTGLELLRNCLTHKVYQKLSRRYLPVLRDFEAHYSNAVPEHAYEARKVWVCWMQGIEQAPALVQRCYRSLQEHITDREIVLLTEQNIDQYCQLPDHILQKYRQGIISRTHFSDLLRIEILCTHGGTWIDATVLCTSSQIPNYMLDSDLFLFQKLKPGADGAAIKVSSWFMTSSAQNKILLSVRHLLWQYWQQENRLIDYFLLHHFIMMAANHFHEDWRQIIQVPNSLPHILLLMLFDPFSSGKWQAVCQSTPFHKLSYKFDEDKLQLKGTYYQHIMSTGAST